MPQPNIGDRVGAIISADNGHFTLAGYGSYQGMEVPPADISEVLHEASFENPKILLDNGKVVWGCECWWGPESAVKASVAKATTVTEVDIEALRKIQKGETA